jgi:hypothetical protein
VEDWIRLCVNGTVFTGKKKPGKFQCPSGIKQRKELKFHYGLNISMEMHLEFSYLKLGNVN